MTASFIEPFGLPDELSEKDGVRIASAMGIAYRVHGGTTDKAGEPYMHHVWEVVARVRRFFETPDHRLVDTFCAAVLHDAVEDARLHDDVRQRIWDACGSEVYGAVDAITRLPQEGWEAYINRVGGHWLARRIKLADLSHNLEWWRIGAPKLAERDFHRLARYQWATRHLLAIEQFS